MGLTRDLDRLKQSRIPRLDVARIQAALARMVADLVGRVGRASLERTAFLGFGIQALMLIILGIASVTAISSALGDVSDLNGVVRQQRLLIDARISVTEEGDRLKAYALHPATTAQDAARKAVLQTAKTVGMATSAAITPKQIEALEHANHLAATGPADFEKLVRDQSRLTADIDTKIYVEGASIQKALDSFVAQAVNSGEAAAASKAHEASAGYALVRIAIERFVADSSPANVQNARDQTLAFEEGLNALYDAAHNPALRAQADQVIKRLIRYDQAFEAVMTLTARRNQLLEHMARDERTIGLALTTVGGEVDQIQDGAASNARLTLGALLSLSTLLSIMGIAFVFLAGIVCRRAVTRPIERITAQMQQLAQGELDHQAEFTERSDEVGEMARALEIFRINAIEVTRLQGEEAARLVAQRHADHAALNAEKHATEERQRVNDEAEQAKRRMLADLAARFENHVARAMDTVAKAARDIDAGANRVATTVASSRQVATEVTAAAIEASASTSTIAAATEEMSLSLREVSHQVSESSRFASRAVDRVGLTDQIVTVLARDAAEIGQVVSLVHEIAQQVNLLALNATIEASRAGEAGRGFAVVAAEVKSLAQQTAAATTQIGERVSSIQAISQNAIQAINEIGQVIGEMGVLASSVATAVEQQVHTTAEIARNTTLAAAGTDRLTDHLKRVQEGVAVSGDAADLARIAAGEVSRQTEALQREVDDFLSTVRAA